MRIVIGVAVLLVDVYFALRFSRFVEALVDFSPLNAIENQKTKLTIVMRFVVAFFIFALAAGGVAAIMQGAG